MGGIPCIFSQNIFHCACFPNFQCFSTLRKRGNTCPHFGPLSTLLHSIIVPHCGTITTASRFHRSTPPHTNRLTIHDQSCDCKIERYASSCVTGANVGAPCWGMLYYLTFLQLLLLLFHHFGQFAFLFVDDEVEISHFCRFCF